MSVIHIQQCNVWERWKPTQYEQSCGELLQAVLADVASVRTALHAEPGAYYETAQFARQLCSCREADGRRRPFREAGPKTAVVARRQETRETF